MKNARWSDVFQSILRSNGLDYRWQGKILQVMTAADKQKEVSLLTLNNQLSEQYQTAAHSGDMMVQVVNVRYSDAASLKTSLTRFVSRNKDAVIGVDQHNNALVIQGTPTEQARILALIDSLDRPRPQVQLKAYIVETTKEKARELGMQWGGRFEHQKLIGGSGSTPLRRAGMEVPIPSAASRLGLATAALSIPPVQAPLAWPLAKLPFSKLNST
ncbi:MAG: secretin N-terminal domain-containing protein [Duodenibacillus massiliensis]